MDIIPSFLTPKRIYNFDVICSSDKYHFFGFFLLNSPLFYSLYNKTFTYNAFVYSYIYCGIFQGIINHYLYILCDYVFNKKPIDIIKWSNTPFYDRTRIVSDVAYMHAIGSIVYASMVVIPEPYKWTFIYPGIFNIIKQLTLVCIIHDFVFYGIHYVVHKVPCLRNDHIKLHHECPLHIGGSRCALSSNESEAYVRDLFSAIFSTYFVNFYAPIWMVYYTLYSFWAMYLHTGANVYHKLHHSNRPMRNYGIYYISDYVLNTLNYDDCSKSN